MITKVTSAKAGGIIQGYNVTSTDARLRERPHIHTKYRLVDICRARGEIGMTSSLAIDKDSRER